MVLSVNGEVELILVEDNTIKEVIKSRNTDMWISDAILWMLYEGWNIEKVFMDVASDAWDDVTATFNTNGYISGANEILSTASGTPTVCNINLFGRWDSGSENWLTYWAGIRKFAVRRGVANVPVHDIVQKVYFPGPGGTDQSYIYVMDDTTLGGGRSITFGSNTYYLGASGLSIYAFRGGVTNPEQIKDSSTGETLQYTWSINPYPQYNSYALGWEPLAVYSGISYDSINKVASMTFITELRGLANGRTVASSGYDTQPIWYDGRETLYSLVLAPTVWLPVDTIQIYPSTTTSGFPSLTYLLSTYTETGGVTTGGMAVPIYPPAIAIYTVNREIDWSTINVFVRWTLKIGR